MTNSEMLAKARTAKSVEELFNMAQEAEYSITEEDAQKIFEQLHTTTALSDDELDEVAGGKCGDGSGAPKFKVGDLVIVLGGKTCRDVNYYNTGCSNKVWKIIKVFKSCNEWNYITKCNRCGLKGGTYAAEQLTLYTK